MASLYHTLNISRQDMLSRLTDLDIVSNNLSNMNTIGFKSSRSNFQELLSTAGTRDGVYIASSQVQMQQGSIKMTGNSLDWAIQGEGFFAVQLPDGQTGYTRDGQFTLDANNELVNGSGYKLIWDGDFPAGTFNASVQTDGTVVALTDNGWQPAGTVALTRFSNPTGLMNRGENIWLPSDSSGEPRAGSPGQNGYGILRAQTLEQSNVDLSQEMTRLMTLQRTFEISTRLFQQTDSMINLAINMRKY